MNAASNQSLQLPPSRFNNIVDATGYQSIKSLHHHKKISISETVQQQIKNIKNICRSELRIQVKSTISRSIDR